MARSDFRFFPKTSVGFGRLKPNKPKPKQKISRSVSRSVYRQTQLNGQCFEGCSMCMCWHNVTYDRMVLTLLEPQSRCGDKPLTLQVVCAQNGTAVLNGLNGPPAVPASAAPDGTGRHKLSYWYARRGPSDVLCSKQQLQIQQLVAAIKTVL